MVGLWWCCGAGWVTISQFGVFYFGFCCGWWLRVEKWKRKVVGFVVVFSLSLSLSLMWFVVVVGKGNGGGVVAIGFCGYCFFYLLF